MRSFRLLFAVTELPLSQRSASATATKTQLAQLTCVCACGAPIISAKALLAVVALAEPVAFSSCACGALRYPPACVRIRKIYIAIAVIAHAATACVNAADRCDLNSQSVMSSPQESTVYNVHRRTMIKHCCETSAVKQLFHSETLQFSFAGKEKQSLCSPSECIHVVYM